MIAHSNARTLQPDELADLLLGVRILGTGGGGDPRRGAAQVEADAARDRAYTLIEPEQVEDDALVLSGGFMGHMAVQSSWDSTIDHWEDVYELEEAVRAMERFLGRKANYLVPFELGGGNTIAILSCAARLGIPAVDGDGIGRAAPETQMSSFAAHGVDLMPMTLFDELGGSVVVERGDLHYPDEVGRFVVARCGGLVANCHFPMRGVEMRRAIVPETVTEAIHVGGALRRLRVRVADIIEGMSEALGASVHLIGRTDRIDERTKGGFFHSEAEIRGAGPFEGKTMTLRIKNEVMAGWIDGRLISIFPDHLYLLDPETGEGLLSRELEVGCNVAILGRPCHARVRETLDSESGRAAFSPRRFGLDVPFTPTEKLIAGFNASEGQSG